MQSRIEHLLDIMYAIATDESVSPNFRIGAVRQYCQMFELGVGEEDVGLRVEVVYPSAEEVRKQRHAEIARLESGEA